MHLVSLNHFMGEIYILCPFICDLNTGLFILLQFILRHYIPSIPHHNANSIWKKYTPRVFQQPRVPVNTIHSLTIGTRKFNKVSKSLVLNWNVCHLVLPFSYCMNLSFLLSRWIYVAIGMVRLVAGDMHLNRSKLWWSRRRFLV